MKKSLKIFKLFGIDIELHYSWVFIFFLLAWGLSTAFFPQKYEGLTKTEYWSIGIISSLLLFASVLAHELSHALIARKNSIKVSKISLFFFGGIAHIEGEENLTPMKEFTMAIAGPICSVILGILFLIIFKYSPFIHLTAVMNYLFVINFILAAFNMAPGYPLDGGRVLRSIIWGITKDIKKATNIAAMGGKAVAVFLIVFGFFGIIVGAGTIWFVILGFFLYFIAGASYEQVIVKEALHNVKVKDVMVKTVKTVSPDIDLADLFENYFLKHSAEGALVAKNKVFLGAVTIDALNTVPKSKWAKTKVKDVLIPASKIPHGKETELAMAALTRMRNMGVMPILKNKKIVGVISGASIMSYVRIKEKVN